MKGLFITRGIDQQFLLFVGPNTDPHELLRQMIEGVTVRVSDSSTVSATAHAGAPTQQVRMALRRFIQKPSKAIQAGTGSRLAATR